MLYQPNYCANCGAKVERVSWGIFTSRRFCDICEIEFKGHDILLRVVAGVILLFGVIGLGSYLKTGSIREPTVARQTVKQAERPMPRETAPQPVSNANSAATAKNVEVITPPVQQLAATKPAAPVREIAEPQYFCGAETKKGTPCSRRVKGNTRCYQHAGMPPMSGLRENKTN